MSENKLIFMWLTSSVLLIFTIIILEQISENKFLFISFLLLVSIILAYYFYDRTNAEKINQQYYSKMLLDARETEKKKIASELHDGLQQNLHSIDMEIQKISKTNFTPKEKLNNISDRIIDTIDEIRRIASELYPHQLENLGLRKAIIGMANNISDISGIHFVTNIENDIDDLFNKDVSIQIFRIIQELYNNIIKHSGATKAVTAISKSKLYLHIDVEDNGFGFENNFIKVDDFRKGLGIRSIRERLKVMSGNLKIKSQQGIGTEFKITIPIKNIYNS